MSGSSTIEWTNATWNPVVGCTAVSRFLSCEPLLAPLSDLPLDDIDWVIVGGESGPGARPMHPDWVRDIRDQCQRAGVAFFFKQWGEWTPSYVDWRFKQVSMLRDGTVLPVEHAVYDPLVTPAGGGDVIMRRVGKRVAGRELDGRAWDEMPTRTGA